MSNEHNYPVWFQMVVAEWDDDQWRRLRDYLLPELRKPRWRISRDGSRKEIAQRIQEYKNRLAQWGETE